MIEIEAKNEKITSKVDEAVAKEVKFTVEKKEA